MFSCILFTSVKPISFSVSAIRGNPLILDIPHKESFLHSLINSYFVIWLQLISSLVSLSSPLTATYWFSLL